MKKITSYIRKIAPWCVAVAIFAYLFRQYPPQNIYGSLRFVDIPFFCVIAVSYFALMFLLDTYSISRVLNAFGHEGTVRELLPARGLTYLIMVINYAAAQAAFAFYQYRRHGLPISKMLGIFGIIVISDLMILATLAFVTTFFTTWPFEIWGMNIAHFVRIFTIAFYAGFVATVVLVRKCVQSGFFKRLRKNKILNLVATTRAKNYANVFVSRLPVHVFIMCGMFLAIKTFNADISFLNILSNIPLVFFIGSLPITPGGLGTSNAALVELMKPFVTSPAITSGAVSAGDLLFSFSLVWMFANYVMKALTGLICLKFTSKDLFKPTPDVSEKDVEETATAVGGNI